MGGGGGGGRGGTQHTDLLYYIFQECSLDFVNLQWLARAQTVEYLLARAQSKLVILWLIFI